MSIISDSIKESADIANDTPNADIKSKKVCGWIKKGEIIPAENHATQIFPNISDTLLSCS